MSRRRELEVSALLEITQAINSNISEEKLYKVFYFTCISNLHLSEIALFVLEDDTFKEKFSHSLSFTTKDLEMFQSHHFDLDEVRDIYPNVSQVFPVKHQNKLLAVLVLGKHNATEIEASFSFLQTLSNIVLVAMENKRLAKQALIQEGRNKEAEIARSVQEMLVPSNLPDNEYFRIAATYLPHQSVGGDYFDVIKVNKGYIFCIADVSGKGVPAALIMSNFQASLRTLCKFTSDVEEIITDLNIHLDENMNADHFVTCFLAFYDTDRNVLEYVNAGHNPPYYLEGQNVLELKNGCYMLGAFPTIPVVKKTEVPVAKNGKLFLFTDGITETIDNDGVEFGEDRLQDFLTSTIDDDLKLNHADLIIAVDSFKEDQDYRDDLTMLSIRFL